MRRVLISLCIVFGAFTPALASAAPTGISPGFPREYVDADSYCADTEEFQLFDMINEYRAENGLEPLVLSASLGAAAQHHSVSMATYNYFDGSHDLHFEGTNQDEQVTWQQNIANHGYPDNTHTSRAENLAAGFETAEETLTQWRNSPSHNDHLLSPKYQAIGIGRAFNPDAEYRWYWTVTFGSLIDSSAAPCQDVATSGAPAPGTRLGIVRSGRNGSSTDSAVAFDGDEATAWYTTKARTPVSGYIWFDLGEARTLSRIEYLFSESGSSDQFEIQISLDRQEWFTIATLSEPEAGAWQTLDWSGEAQYVRFVFSNPNDDAVLGFLAEVRFFA